MVRRVVASVCLVVMLMFMAGVALAQTEWVAPDVDYSGAAGTAGTSMLTIVSGILPIAGAIFAGLLGVTLLFRVLKKAAR